MGSIEIKKQLADREDKLPINRQCKLMSIAKSSYYYIAKGENPENEEIMKMMDKHI